MPQTELDRVRAAFGPIENAYRRHIAAGRCLGDTCEITAHVEYLAARTRLEGLKRGHGGDEVMTLRELADGDRFRRRRVTWSLTTEVEPLTTSVTA